MLDPPLGPSISNSDKFVQGRIVLINSHNMHKRNLTERNTPFKGQFIPRESKKDQRINGKHQRKFSLSLLRTLSLGLSTTYSYRYSISVPV